MVQVAAAVATPVLVFVGIAVTFWRRRRPGGDASSVGATSTLGLSTPASGSAQPGIGAPGDVSMLAPTVVPPASTSVRGLSEAAARLEPAARLLGASGVAVWACSPDGRQLDVLASHGYSEGFLARITPIPLDAHVLTTVAFTERRVCTRARRAPPGPPPSRCRL